MGGKKVRETLNSRCSSQFKNASQARGKTSVKTNRLFMQEEEGLSSKSHRKRTKNRQRYFHSWEHGGASRKSRWKEPKAIKWVWLMILPWPSPGPPAPLTLPFVFDLSLWAQALQGQCPVQSVPGSPIQALGFYPSLFLRLQGLDMVWLFHSWDLQVPQLWPSVLPRLQLTSILRLCLFQGILSLVNPSHSPPGPPVTPPTTQMAPQSHVTLQGPQLLNLRFLRKLLSIYQAN